MSGLVPLIFFVHKWRLGLNFKIFGSLSIVGVNKIRNQVSAAGAKAPAAFFKAGIGAKFYF
jgi:hypothetical protein